MYKEQFLKELKFEKETYKPKCWKTVTCAICGKKADFGREIYLNIHCKKCYKDFYRKIRIENVDKKILYKKIINKNERIN